MAAAATTTKKKLLEGLNKHVDYEDGISNSLLKRLAFLSCSSYFAGVFSADCIPKHLAGKNNFIIIVNLGERKGRNGALPVGHFVAIVATPSSVLYIDPYGLPCYQPKVCAFLLHCRRQISENKRQIQHLNSVYCGFFCLLFALYLDRSSGLNKPKFKLKFYRRANKLTMNDSICVKYLKKLFLS